MAELLKRLQEAGVFKPPSPKEIEKRNEEKWKSLFYCPSCKEFGYDYGEGFRTASGRPECLTCDREMEPVKFTPQQKVIYKEIEKLEEIAHNAFMQQDAQAARDPYPHEESAFAARYASLGEEAAKAQKKIEDLMKKLNYKPSSVVEAGVFKSPSKQEAEKRKVQRMKYVKELKVKCVELLKEKGRAYVDLDIDWDTILWKAVKSSEADDIEVGKFYYGNYDMHYRGFMSIGFSTPEEAVEDLFTQAIESDVHIDVDAEVTVPTDQDIIDFPDFEHGCEELIATIIGHIPPED